MMKVFQQWVFGVTGGILIILLIVFLVRQNLADKKRLEQQLNQDYHRPPEHEEKL
jgi:hypothetical protein